MSLNVIKPTFEADSVMVEKYIDYGNSQNCELDFDPLESIADLKKLLAEANDLSKRVEELEEAVKKKDKSRIAAFAEKVTSGTASSLITKLASEGLLKFLGLA